MRKTLAAAAAVCALAALPATAAAETSNVTVPGTAGANASGVWNDANTGHASGITLAAGDSASVTAGGLVNWNGSSTSAPDGWDGYDFLLGTCPAGPGVVASESAECFGLLARVGESGPWTYVGVGPTVLTGVGQIYFVVNDDNYGDNSGQYDAVVDVTRAAVGCSTVFGGLMQPINADGSSVFKLGSTVPVKIAPTCDGAFADGLELKVTLGRYAGDALLPGTAVEVVSSSAADSGNTMRASDDKYVYNLSTKLSPFFAGAALNGRYRVAVTQDGVEVAGADFTVKK